MTQEQQNRSEVLKAMNTIVKSLNDASGYYNCWIFTIPDQADDEELEEIAIEQEDTFAEAVNDFLFIMEKYSKSGLYINGKLYK